MSNFFSFLPTQKVWRCLPTLPLSLCRFSDTFSAHLCHHCARSPIHSPSSCSKTFPPSPLWLKREAKKKEIEKEREREKKARSSWQFPESNLFIINFLKYSLLLFFPGSSAPWINMKCKFSLKCEFVPLLFIYAKYAFAIFNWKTYT